MSKPKKRTIGIEGINEIREAHRRLVTCLEVGVSLLELDEAEFLLRKALAHLGVETQRREPHGGRDGTMARTKRIEGTRLRYR